MSTINYGVTTTSRDYEEWYPVWSAIRKLYKGEYAVKKAGTELLPNPYNGGDKKEIEAAYLAYKERAPFLEITSITADSIAGLINRKPAQIDLPPQMEYLRENFNGSGLSLTQHINRSVHDNILLGRFGMLVELPNSTSQASLADNKRGNNMPHAVFYEAENILLPIVKNNKLIQVTLREVVEIDNDKKTIFGCETEYQYRVLLLTDDKYEQRLYKHDASPEVFEQIDVLANGKSLDFIPFQFCGAKNNDWKVDKPPMSGVASANKTHYQYSADARNIAHQTSFISTFINGFRDTEQRDAWYPSGLCFGTSAINFLPEGSEVSVAQGTESNAASRGQDQALKEAISAGAKLITENVNQTATAASIQAVGATSVTSQVAHNVEDAYTKVLNWIAEILGVSLGEDPVVINRDFGLNNMDAQIIQQWLAMKLDGIVTAKEFREALQKGGHIEDIEIDESELKKTDNGDQISNRENAQDDDM